MSLSYNSNNRYNNAHDSFINNNSHLKYSEDDGDDYDDDDDYDDSDNYREYDENEEPDDDEPVVVSCYFCDDMFYKKRIIPDFEYDVYNKILVCNECYNNYLMSPLNNYDNKQLEILDNKYCGLCHTNRKSIELLQCNHTICIRCYKKKFFGYSTNLKPCHPLEFTHSVPYISSNNLSFNYDYDLYIKKYLENNNIETIGNLDIETYIKEIKTNQIEYRLWWLNGEKYTNWEINYLKYKIKKHTIQIEWDKWINDKRTNRTEKGFNCTQCLLKIYRSPFKEKFFYKLPTILKTKIKLVMLLYNRIEMSSEFYLPIEIWLYTFKHINIMDYCLL
jgi:hypothetical protein